MVEKTSCQVITPNSFIWDKWTSMTPYIDKDTTSPQWYLCQEIQNPSLNMRKLQSNPK